MALCVRFVSTSTSLYKKWPMVRKSPFELSCVLREVIHSIRSRGSGDMLLLGAAFGHLGYLYLTWHRELVAARHLLDRMITHVGSIRTQNEVVTL
jgi:hypothetical protein